MHNSLRCSFLCVSEVLLVSLCNVATAAAHSASAEMSCPVPVIYFQNKSYVFWDDSSLRTHPIKRLAGESVMQSKSGRWRQERERNSDTPALATADSLTADSAAVGGDSGLLSWAGADVGNERI